MSDSQIKKGKNWKERVSAFVGGIKIWLETLTNHPNAFRGAVIAVGVGVTIGAVYLATDLKSGIGLIPDMVLVLIASVIGFFILFWVTNIALEIFRKIPVKLAAGFIAGYIFFNEYLWEISEESTWYISAGLILVEMLLGVVLYELIKEGWRTARLQKRIILVFCLILSVGINIYVVVWLMESGVDDYLLDIDPYRGEPTILVNNPSLPGYYKVETLFYGSGTDMRRNEYGEGVDILTPTVNASSYVSITGLNAKARNLYWGFTPNEYPLNGRVWYPQGQGSFPLVLIVHGNHNMTEYSDPGYGYLCDLLASRGYICVSIDENFLNGYFMGKVSGENDARGWILLKHLEVWEKWDKDPASPFYRLVDMENIALAGHSRGGEAVALAASFNELERYPNAAWIKWDFNFEIKSVIAIAPVDQQHKPAGHPVELEDVNYFVLHGAHDADVSKYYGLRQFQRVTFTDPESEFIKAGLYIYQANHGQFNSVWGNRDYGLPLGQFLNVKPLLQMEEQQQIAKLYISAFLDATLKNETGLLPLFQDYRNAGNWLPPTLYINQFQDAGYRPVATYEEDYDVTTTTVGRGSITGYGLNRWKELKLEFRTGKSQDNYAVVLGWGNDNASYVIKLPTGLASQWELGEEDHLVFNLADGRDPEEFETLLDFTIVLKDRNGESAGIAVSDVIPLLPQFRAQITKLDELEERKYETPSEPIFQTYQILLSAFIDANPDLQLENLAEIQFVYNLCESGEIILDEIGFSLRK